MMFHDSLEELEKVLRLKQIKRPIIIITIIIITIIIIIII